MKIPQEVLAVLSESEVRDNRLILPPGLERKLYISTNRVIEALGGKWDRRAMAHVFRGEAESLVDDAVLSGQVEVTKDEYNIFYSPPEIVQRLVNKAMILPGMRVLEPEAGEGAIAKEIAKITPPDCWEIRRDSCDRLLELAGVGSIILGDFLTSHPRPIFDRVVMNPPFSHFRDVKHVTHAFKFLKPSIGRLVAIMGNGVTFRREKIVQEFRDFVDRLGGQIEPLPEGSFRSSGTMVNAVMVTIDN